VTIAQFILRLAAEPEFFKQYTDADDKAEFLERLGLDENQRRFLLSGNLRHIRVHIEAELQVDGEIFSIGTVHSVPITVHTPPDPGTAQ
jgi:hypothetical protein